MTMTLQKSEFLVVMKIVTIFGDTLDTWQLFVEWRILSYHVFY